MSAMDESAATTGASHLSTNVSYDIGPPRSSTAIWNTPVELALGSGNPAWTLTTIWVWASATTKELQNAHTGVVSRLLNRAVAGAASVGRILVPNVVMLKSFQTHRAAGADR